MADEFSQLNKTVPGMDLLLKAAPAASGAVGCGCVGCIVEDRWFGRWSGGCSQRFSKLGLKPELVAKAIPVLTSFVSKWGGADVANLLAGVEVDSSLRFLLGPTASRLVRACAVTRPLSRASSGTLRAPGGEPSGSGSEGTLKFRNWWRGLPVRISFVTKWGGANIGSLLASVLKRASAMRCELSQIVTVCLSHCEIQKTRRNRIVRPWRTTHCKCLQEGVVIR